MNLWGSDPNEGNDDCHTGQDFETREEAEVCFQKPWEAFDESYYGSCTHTVELDGPDVHLERQNPSFKPSKDSDKNWRREQALEAGMAFGVEAYNEYMGWD